MSRPARFPSFPANDGPTSALSDVAQQTLQSRAADEEGGALAIGGSIDILRQAGLMLQDGAEDAPATAKALMQIGAANLSVGRLFEGHVNALRLIRLYGSKAQRSHAERLIASDALFGVWGADGKRPVTLTQSGDLGGEKLFASGLGTVTHALITANSGPEVQLILVDVRDRQRADASQWHMSGMRATASGKYDFSGLSTQKDDLIGAPGDYLREPHFVGGVWRIAALQAGASAGLLAAAAGKLRDMERLDAEAQKARLMQVLMRVWAGMALVERAASAAQSNDFSCDTLVANAIAARLYTEEIGLEAINAVEQSLGLGHFTQASETGRMARDLSVYLRQAARDAFLQRAARHALSADETIWGLFK